MGVRDALRAAAQSGTRVDFEVTPLNMLVDSPLDLGRFVRKWNLWREGAVLRRVRRLRRFSRESRHTGGLLAAYQRVPAEAFALYGSRHFYDYHALLTLSDSVGFEGIEHHQSSDDRAPADFLTDSDESLASGDLITHEFSHSWNGKYRRPADLTTPNFQVPQLTDLLWVYEGMNQYLGDLLSFRAGIREPSNIPSISQRRTPDGLRDGARRRRRSSISRPARRTIYVARGDYGAIRRNANDFYTEGELLWLDVDTIIRERSHGARSLDTFLHLFTEPALTGPIVKTYTRAQVEALLDEVEPYDWHAFFEKYVY